MSLRQKTFLLSSIAAGLALAELCLSAFGVGLRYRLPLLVGVAVVAFMLWRQFQGMLGKLSSIRNAIEDTARGEFTKPVPVEEKDEIGNLAEVVRRMRKKLYELSSQVYESVRVESVNICCIIVCLFMSYQYIG